MSNSIVVLGGSGAMTSSCVYDLCQTSDFDKIIIADADEESAEKLVGMADGNHVSFEPINATDTDDIARVLDGTDYVVNGLPYPFEETVLDAIVDVGSLTGVDLNAFDFDAVLNRSEEFAEADCSLWFANGGLVSTIALGMVGCAEFDSVEAVNFYWGMWRLLTQTTDGLTATVTYEHNPNINERARWEDGEVIDDLPPFSKKRTFEFPDPIGKQETYVISHPEPITFPDAPIAEETGVERIISRGVWHEEWAEYERTLHAMDAFDADTLKIEGGDVDPLEVAQEQVKHAGREREEWKPPEELSTETDWTPQTILSSEVVESGDKEKRSTVHHLEQPYPFFGGNDVTTMREYGCYVGVPLSVTLQLMADGSVDETGIFVTETSGLDAEEYFEEMESRGFKLTKEKPENDDVT